MIVPTLITLPIKSNTISIYESYALFTVYAFAQTFKIDQEVRHECRVTVARNLRTPNNFYFLLKVNKL